MSEPFIAEVRIFPYTFAPRGWANCDGQLLPISQNTALFALVGTTYGGDGRTTFGLPNLKGRGAMHPGRGPGLTSRRLGERGGVEQVTLTGAQMANHTHAMRCTPAPGDQPGPAGNTFARALGGATPYLASANLVDLADQALLPAGGGQSHLNQQPFLTLRFCIALQGIFPSRN